MPRMHPRRWSASFVLVPLALASACYTGTFAEPEPGDAESTSTSANTTTSATSPGTSAATSVGPLTSATSEGDSGTTMAVVDDGSTTAAPDMGPTIEPCPATAFCEPFDDYSETSLADGQTFGPWRGALSDAGATMDLDGTHTVSGDRALHVRLEQGGTSGGRLFTTDGLPFLSDSPTHVYGRMMMYIAESGTSVHWTFFGVQGPAEPSAPLAGNYSSYIMSSLPSDGVNTYSFVDGLSCEVPTLPSYDELCPLYHGTLREGDECFLASLGESDCDRGLFCIAHICRDPSRTAFGRAGEPCDLGNLCDEGLVCFDSLCDRLPSAGEPCLSYGCNDESYCDAGLCEALPGPGERCDAGQCLAGLLCRFDPVDGVSVCQVSGDVGDPCTGHRQCQSGNCPAGFCEEPADVGDPCGSQLPCGPDLLCDGGLCRPAGDGAPTSSVCSLLQL